MVAIKLYSDIITTNESVNCLSIFIASQGSKYQWLASTKSPLYREAYVVAYLAGV